MVILRGIVKIFDPEQPFHPGHAVFVQGNGAGLLFLGVVLLFPKLRNDAVYLVIKFGRFFRRTRYDERRPRFVDQDAVHFVHDGVVQIALDKLLMAELHVVPQVIEPEFVVGPVGYVRIVGLLPFTVVQPVDDTAHRQPQESVYLPHPLAVALGEIIVYRNQVDALAVQRIQINRHGRHQGLAFAGFHFGDFSLVKNKAAYQLDVEGPHPQGTDGCLPRHRKSFGEKIVEFFPVFQPLPEFSRLPRSSASLSFRIPGSKPLISSTMGASLFRSRSFWLPNIFLRTPVII